jgi:hypothetical protein
MNQPRLSPIGGISRPGLGDANRAAGARLMLLCWARGCEPAWFSASSVSTMEVGDAHRHGEQCWPERALGTATG